MEGIIHVILIPLCVTLCGALLFELFRNIKKDIQITCEAKSLRKYNERESESIGISLSYKNERVGDTLVVATVSLTNTGKKDITFNHVFEDKIGVVLKNARILDVIVEKESDNVASKVEKVPSKGDQWFLSWGILKKKERILLRIVAAYQNRIDSTDINSLANDLRFVFRGNNIDRIEFNSPTSIRSVKKGLWFVAALLLMCVFVMPTGVDVRYNVKANGSYFENVSIDYNEYTREYLLIRKGDVSRVSQIDSISVSEQPIIATEVYLFACVLIGYIFLFFSVFYILKRSPKNRIGIFRETMSFFFPFVAK